MCRRRRVEAFGPHNVEPTREARRSARRAGDRCSHENKDIEDDGVKLLEVRSWRVRAKRRARRGADDAQYQLLEQNMRFVRV